MGIVRAYQKGTLKGEATPEVQGAASSMKEKDVKKFASTKHKGLPEKKVTKESFNEDYVKELEDGLVKMDYPTYDEVDKLMCKIAKENDIDTTTLHMAFKTKHLMVPDDWAKKKMMEPVMIPKTPKITGDVKEGVTAKERFKRDAGKIAKNKLRQKEHEKYVNFLNVDESLDKDDKPFVKKLVGKLRKGSKTHAKQADDLETAMNESSNSKQQAAIAISKRKRLEDMMVKRKKKLKEEQNPEGMKYSDKKKIERQELLKKASAKAPVVKNKIVPIKTSTEEVIYEYDGNYHMNKIAKEKKLDLTDPRQRRRANSLARHNAAKGNVNNPMGRKKRKKKRKLLEGNLHKWFKGSKSKDGKGGWVNVVTGGTCASDEPGEGTPKCVSSSKRASMTKAERLSASRRKKKADPNQQSKSGAAKPTYVSTDKKKVKKESYIPEEGYDHIKDRIAMAGGNPGSKKKKDATTIKKDFKDYKRERKGDTNYQKEMRKKYGGRLPSALELVKAKQIEKYGKGAIMDEYINELETKTMLNYIDKASDSASNQINKAKKFESKGKLKKAAKARLKMEKRESGIAMAKDKILKRQEDKTLTSLKRSYEGPDAVREEKKVMGKIKKSFKRDEYGDPIKPDGSYAGKLNIDKNPKDEKITRSEGYVLEDMSGMSQKSGDKRSTESGAGMTAAGVAKYNRRTGGNLKTAVTGKVKRGSKAAKRRKSFCARSKGWTGERGKAARRRWKCNNSVDHMFELEHGEILNERGPQTLGSGARQSSIHAKKGKKSTKKVSGMIKSLKRKGSVLKQSMGPLDASRKASRLKNLRDDVDLTILRLIDEGHMNKTCGEGEYYCYQSKKCKKIPKGMKIGYGGMLKPEKDDSEESKGKNGKNGNGNGNGNGHGGNGNGNGNGGGDGGGE